MQLIKHVIKIKTENKGWPGIAVANRCPRRNSPVPCPDFEWTPLLAVKAPPDHQHSIWRQQIEPLLRRSCCPTAEKTKIEYFIARKPPRKPKL